MTRIKFSNIVFGCLCVVTALAFFNENGTAFQFPANATESAEATELVRSVIHEGTTALGRTQAPDGQEVTIASIFERSFATTRVGSTLLGDRWQSASTTEKTEFLGAFGHYIADTVIRRFSEGELKIFDATEPQNSPAGVYFWSVSTVFVTNTSSHSIKWHVGIENGEMKIFDIFLRGRSLINEKAQEFAKFFHENDGSIGDLIAFLSE